jgi:ubiquinone/menaquinone biosynthesis C-methylase UbiE
MSSQESLPDPSISIYYNRGREQERLMNANGKLEFVRTQEILLRYLPKPPATILDVGGGAGIYALWLAREGYTVHLIDLMPLHIEQAAAASTNQPDFPLASMRVGDARQIEFPDQSADAVLLLGPLYHLTERIDRVKALAEAYRAVKPGGVVCAAVISRFASFMDGAMRGFLADPYFAELVEQDLIDGQHRNPKEQPGYFATAYFHHPDEIEAEFTDAGLTFEARIAVEGPGSFVVNFDTFWSDETRRETLLRCIRSVESEPTMLGCTGHIIGVGRKA